MLAQLDYAAPSPPASFVHDLATLAPPSEHVSWLRVTWRPDWGRWCIWQLTPPGAVPSIMWGPDTRVLVRGETILGKRMIRLAPDPRFKLILNRGNMTRYAWELHLETGAYPQPLWVVQGPRGGHKWNFSDQESRLLQMAGHDGEPPEPGTLPYAPLDRRVFDKLVVLDRLRTWNLMSRALHELDERDFDRAEHAQMVEANRQLWNWMKTQVDVAADESGVTGRDRKHGGYRDADAGYEAIEEQFITSTD